MVGKRRPHGTGSLSQRADGLWVARVDAGWTPQGTRRRVTVSSKSKTVAARKLKELQRRIAAGNLPAAASARVTVKAWADEWLPMHATKVRPTTYTTDAGTIGKWIVPTIGHRRLADLTPGDLRAVRDAITDPKQKGGPRSTTTAAHAHRVLRKMLRDAIIEGHAVPPRVLEVDAPRKAVSDRTAIPPLQAVAILRVVDKRPDAARWIAGILEGIRQGEVLGLTWDVIDLDRELMDISWQLQRLPRGHVTPDGWEARHLVGTSWLTRPKTSAGSRIVPMVPSLAATLRIAREAWEPNPWGLVFADDGHPIRAEDDRATFHAIQQEAEAAHPSGRPWHGHEMRHFAISFLLARGVDRSVIQRIVGQSKLVETYVHVDLEQMRVALEGSATALGLEG